MPTILTLEHFAPYVGQEFVVTFGASPSSVTLIEAVLLDNASDPRRIRAAFSLLFRDPSQGVWPQALYSVEHATLGTLDIFLVPLGVDADGVTYEAVFN